MAKKRMGVLCKLLPEEGADTKKIEAYDNTMKELSQTLEAEALEARREAAWRKRCQLFCEKCGAGRETHKLVGKSMGRNCGLTVEEGANLACLREYYRARRVASTMNKKARIKEYEAMQATANEEEVETAA